MTGLYHFRKVRHVIAPFRKIHRETWIAKCLPTSVGWCAYKRLPWRIQLDSVWWQVHTAVEVDAVATG